VARKISPLTRPISGTLELPGDKSISHRYAILAALAEGRSEIANFSTAQDCWSTLECLRRLGVHIEAVTAHLPSAGNSPDPTNPAISPDHPPADQASSVLTIEGRGLNGLRGSLRALDAGNSGTTMRLLAGALTGQSFNSKITGDASLRRRPMGRVIAPLREMGADIQPRNDDFAPLRIRSHSLRPIDYALPLPSAQVKSAILLAGLFADGWTTVREAAATRDHTEIALREFGAEVKQLPGIAAVRGVARLQPRALRVPGDFSSAAFFIGAALLLPGSELLISNVGLNPTRTTLLDVLAEWGAPPRIVSVQMAAGELVGSLLIRHAPLSGGVLSAAQIPGLIDELPLLAALGPYTEQGIEIRDARELRVKETDRIAALTAGLTALGARVEEFPDGLRIAGRASVQAGTDASVKNVTGGHRMADRLTARTSVSSGIGASPVAASPLHGAELDPRIDHRIAMALTIAALGASGDSVLRDSECVAASFPEFFTLLEGITGVP
jgi:3-phosphoshikimate 1-carboxyvinyltransferase